MLTSLQHGTWPRRADLLAYAGAVLLMAGSLTQWPSDGDHAGMAARVLAGMLSWTLIEYTVHGFVLHRLQPFKTWHAAHHDHPAAAFGLPTAFSALRFVTVLFAPTRWLAGLWAKA